MLKPRVARWSAMAALSAMLPSAASAETFARVTPQPASTDPLVARYALEPAKAPQLPDAEMARFLREKIKYVFVLFNENESFDHEYGTFPGANNLYSDGQTPRSGADTPGFRQHYVDSAGVAHEVTPFLTGPDQNATVTDSVDHSHKGLAAKLAVATGVPHMSGFSQVEYNGKAGASVTTASDAKGRQYANLVMSYVDCDTIPFFWQYANRFTLFDNMFATEDTPSSPNAVAMIAGQAGESQWVQHGSAGYAGPVSGTINGQTFSGNGTTQGVPVMNDPQPFYGSQFDTTPMPFRQPTAPKETFAIGNIATNLTSATLLLTLAGTDVTRLLAGDLHAATNQADIQHDIPAIAATGNKATSWRWYENGYDREPTDTADGASHTNWVSHHSGPSYFGYIANNKNEIPNLRGEGDLFSDLASGNLPKDGGVFYVRGGYQNLQGLHPPIQNNAFPSNAITTGGLSAADIQILQATKAGDDDHPGYSDRMISEAMNARVINAIASSPTVWAQSAIVITYDESDGFYDHVPPRILAYGPDGLPQARGIRVPLIVISPYARTHVVSHAEGDHNAVIETINAIFGLPALASLPDEATALKNGNAAAFNAVVPASAPAGFKQLYLGPRDINTPITDSLLSAFDPRRLQGTAPMLPASYAMIPEAVVKALPHYGAKGCEAIGMIPEDRRQGLSAPPPVHYNSLPSTLSKYNMPAPE